MDTANEAVRSLGVVRPAQLKALGVSTSWIPIITCFSALRYEPPGVVVPWWPAYPLAVRASVKWPRAVIAGPSALHLHGLCDEPARLWLAVDIRAHAPRPVVPMRVLRCRGLRGDADVTELPYGRVMVPIFSVARALVDCLRLRDEIPFELTRTAMSKALEKQLATAESVLQCAQRRHFGRTIQLSLEALRLPLR